MRFAGSYAGLGEEVARALLDLAHCGERHREHLRAMLDRGLIVLFG